MKCAGQIKYKKNHIFLYKNHLIKFKLNYSNNVWNIIKKNENYFCVNENGRGGGLIESLLELCGLLFPRRVESGGWIPKPCTDTISLRPVSFTMSLKSEGQWKKRAEDRQNERDNVLHNG